MQAKAKFLCSIMKIFKENRSSEPEENRIKPCIKGQYEYASLRGIFPEECEKAFIEGMEHFDRYYSRICRKRCHTGWRGEPEPLPRYAYTEMKRFRVRDYQGCIHVEKARATQAALLQRLWMAMYVAEQIASCYSPIALIKKHALQ